MKKRLAIFVLVVFFFAQFGKVVNFFYCTITVYQQSKTLNCDCEKQLANAVNTESNNHPSHNSAEHPQLDELFHRANMGFLIYQHSLTASKWPQMPKEALYHVFGKNIFHPPLQVS